MQCCIPNQKQIARRQTATTASTTQEKVVTSKFNTSEKAIASRYLFFTKSIQEIPMNGSDSDGQEEEDGVVLEIPSNTAEMMWHEVQV